MPTSLDGIAVAAKRDKRKRFRSLYQYLNRENFAVAYGELNRQASAGVDGINWLEYGRKLDENLTRLEEELKAKRYRAKFVKRVMIPKGTTGAYRPLSIPAIEDKIVQYVVKEILQHLYEPLFLPCSWGYRPHRSARQAVEVFRREVNERCSWVVEADIRNYFGTIEHEKLVEMLQRRIDDRALIGLIRKWLKAGILQPDGVVEYPQEGTAQGSLVSPVLSNIYLHYVLDEWFEQQVLPQSSGRQMYLRYADDYVAGFQYHMRTAV